MKQVRVYLRPLLFISLIAGFAGLLSAQTQLVRSVTDNLERYQNTRQPQKLFIHLDKENHAAGETIWFKGYLIDGRNHRPVADTANVYVELWNTLDEKVSELVLKPRHGSFFGDIELSDEIPDGNYVLRAYTDWMLNQGEDFLFYKYFYISNPQFANAIDNNIRRFNREFNSSLESLRQVYTIAFFPEGGRFVNGLESRVASKVSDATSRGQRSRGNIIDDTGAVVASFETNDAGLGMFSIIPKAGRSYVAEVNTGGRRSLVEALPAATSQGCVMKAEIKGDLMEVNVFSSQQEEINQAYTLLAHARGKVLFTRNDLKVQGNQTLQFPLSDFPTGITHLTLFGLDGVPLTERLVFINHDDQVYFDIRALALRGEEANALSIDVLATDVEGQPVKGNFSVAVQYGDVDGRTNAENIFSYFFLSYDLKGLVEDPAQYFDYTREEVDEMVDLLMLTHEWQRFSWDELVNAPLPETSFSPVYGIDVFGNLVSQADFQGVGNAELQMRVVEDHSKVFKTRTDAPGKFLFRGLDLPESTLVEFIPPMMAGRTLPEVDLAPSARKDVPLEDVSYEPNMNTLTQQITQRGSNWSRPRKERSAAGHSRGGQLFGTPDQTIYIDDNEPYSSVIDVLRDKAIGLTISPGGFITIRGIRSINYQSPPLFFVDGIESEGAFFSSHPHDIERIEVFRGASTAAFGARGASGALAAYTKRRDYEAELLPASIFRISGMHAPRQFPFEPEKAATIDQVNNTKTAFWEPGLKTGEDGLANFQFFPLSGITQYRIVIQGVTEDGKIGFAEFVIGN